MITLLLDVRSRTKDILPWRLMCDYARSLAQRMGAASSTTNVGCCPMRHYRPSRAFDEVVRAAGNRESARRIARRPPFVLHVKRFLPDLHPQLTRLICTVVHEVE